MSSSLSASFSLTQLDGYIARTWPSQKSALGSALDPLADKILISILYVSLTYAELIPGIGLCVLLLPPYTYILNFSAVSPSYCVLCDSSIDYTVLKDCLLLSSVLAPLTALVIFRDIGLIAAVFWVRYKTVPPPVRHVTFHSKQALKFFDLIGFEHSQVQ